MQKNIEEFSEEELSDALAQKRIASREARIAAFRMNGRSVHPDSAPINAELRLYSENKTESSTVRSPRKKSILDILLLFVEIGAIIGIITLLIIGSQTLQKINREASGAFSLPTLTPTPLIRSAVLPGGHTVPNAAGHAEFNQAEIPPNLRALSDFSPIPTLNASVNQIVRIRIPAIAVDAPVVNGDDWEMLKNGVGQSGYSAKPGRSGNVILSGHNDIYGEVFRHLDKLKPGDEIILMSESQNYTYLMTETKIVSPSQVDVMNQTADATVTLISCYPYLIDDQRIVIIGKRTF